MRPQFTNARIPPLVHPLAVCLDFAQEGYCLNSIRRDFAPLLTIES